MVLPIAGAAGRIALHHQHLPRKAMCNHSKIDVFNFSDEIMRPGEPQNFNIDVSFLSTTLLGTKTQHFLLQQVEFLKMLSSLHYRVPKNHALYVAPLRG